MLHKNLLITNLAGEIIYLGETVEGSIHDKKIYQQAQLYFPDQRHCLWVDLGFVGIEAEGVKVFMPEKKPKENNSPNFKSS